MERRSPPRGCAGSAHRGPDPASGREASGRCGSPRRRRRTLASDGLLSAVLSRVVPLGLARLVPRLNLPVRSPDRGCSYTRGGYTTTAVGASPDDPDVLAEPVGGRI